MQALVGRGGYFVVAAVRDPAKMDAVAKDANVAKGAVYHHFASKEDLFTQVFEQVSGQLALTVASSIPQEADRISALKAATRTYFQLCAEPAITRITLQDAPSILGFERWRQIDAAHFGGLVSAGLSLAMEDDLMTRQPVGPLSNIVLAAPRAARGIGSRGTGSRSP